MFVLWWLQTHVCGCENIWIIQDSSGWSHMSRWAAVSDFMFAAVKNFASELCL